MYYNFTITGDVKYRSKSAFSQQHMMSNLHLYYFLQ